MMGLWKKGLLWLAALVVAPAALAQELPLTEGWRFVKEDVPGAERPGFDDANWSRVAVPHTYNAEDSGIGGTKARGEPEGAYYRGPAWYRLKLDHKPLPGTRYLLHFGGATLKADVWLNGEKLGAHAGGYAAFRFDVTGKLRAGENLLAVRVDNARNPHISPLNGDFNVFGGLYREVKLIATPDLHLDRLDHAGPGIRARTEALGKNSATIGATVAVVNDRAAPASFQVVTRILDAQGKAVATQRSPLTLGPGERGTAEQRLTLKAPKLWEGRKSPYLYRVKSEVVTNGQVIDSQSVPLGVRTVAVKPDGAFLLNGKPYRLYGVNLQHPSRFGRGPIVTQAEIDEDLQLFADMGVTGIRLAHMQHPQRIYDRADELGILILTEVPLVDDHDQSDEFRGNVVQQMRELIAQHYNNPSVALWGLGNEIRKSDAASNRILADLNRTAKTLDPLRPTTYAHCCIDDKDPIALHSDTVSYNRYFGWYLTKSEDFGPWADELHARLPGRPIGVSEYGAGASILHQEDPVVKRPEPNGYWHPEQYQTDFHIKHWLAMKKRPFLWSTFAWVGIDFPSFKRNEGDRPAINDKGLVTEDRKPKDAYFWYQANWSDKPMLHLTSRRDVSKRTQRVKVMAFSNQAAVEFRLNGDAWQRVPVADRMATWTIELAKGENRVEARARTAKGETLSDAVTWTYATRP
ncbi:glycoside hydrolase family 2 protein [Sphingomonas sp. BT-65]|uniref:glycoside hydrolase family 2 protein n=1 Tax=Sphingomonas sp. BT-65 TaxID=2989821 RepID=UPI002236189D|nr:glycoside hydrolase family 2 TIM barrel-domain containing protein [Sphingomonas sp. BT-65]MCW4462792.1 glycoside hydrolase family 2 protein [Sphingomonas sp. BT-65]